MELLQHNGKQISETKKTKNSFPVKDTNNTYTRNGEEKKKNATNQTIWMLGTFFFI